MITRPIAGESPMWGSIIEIASESEVARVYVPEKVIAWHIDDGRRAWPVLVSAGLVVTDADDEPMRDVITGASEEEAFSKARDLAYFCRNEIEIMVEDVADSESKDAS